MIQVFTEEEVTYTQDQTIQHLIVLSPTQQLAMETADSEQHFMQTKNNIKIGNSHFINSKLNRK